MISRELAIGRICVARRGQKGFRSIQTLTLYDCPTQRGRLMSDRLLDIYISRLLFCCSTRTSRVHTPGYSPPVGAAVAAVNMEATLAECSAISSENMQLRADTLVRGTGEFPLLGAGITSGIFSWGYWRLHDHTYDMVVWSNCSRT